MVEGYFETDYFILRIRDGILFSTFSENLEIDLFKARLFVEQRRKLCNSAVMPMLFDARNLKSIDKPARDLLCSKSSTLEVSANAMIIKNESQRLLGMIFIFYNGITVPFRIFNDEHLGIYWLKHFKNLN